MVYVPNDYELPPDIDTDCPEYFALTVVDGGTMNYLYSIHTAGLMNTPINPEHIYIDCRGDDDEGSQIVANATDAEEAMTWNDLFGISCSKLKCILQNQALFDAVSGVANSEATTEDITGAALDNMGEDCSMESFEAALDWVEKIDFLNYTR